MRKAITADSIQSFPAGNVDSCFPLDDTAKLLSAYTFDNPPNRVIFWIPEKEERFALYFYGLDEYG